MSSFEPRVAFEHLDKLAYEIGPRLAGTRGAVQAQKYIQKCFKSYGLKTEIQEFRFANVRTRLRVSGVMLIGVFVSTLFLSALCALAASVAAVGLFFLLPHLLAVGKTTNVIGSIKVKEPKKRLLVTAHYDSAYCTRSRRITMFLRFATLPVLATFLGVLALVVALGAFNVWPIVWIVLAFFLLPTCGLMFTVLKKQVSPGANDNASGVAVMMEVARAIANDPPKDLAIDFVAFGAEEQGLVGSKKLSSSFKPGEVSVINIDTVGTGQFFYVVTGNGIIRKRGTSPELNKALEKAASVLRLEMKSMWTLLAGHDHIPFVRRGIAATTLTAAKPARHGFDEFVEKKFGIKDARSRQYQHLHTLEDVPDRVGLGNIGYAGRIVLNFIKDYN